MVSSCFSTSSTTLTSSSTWLTSYVVIYTRINRSSKFAGIYTVMQYFLTLLIVYICVELPFAVSNGCNWSGHMPGPGKSAPCPYPVSGETCPSTPSYAELQGAGKLWPCPSYTKTQGAQFYAANCTTGTGANPLCAFNSASPAFGCCCPRDGCWAPPQFNWIIGVCKGNTCGGYNSAPSTKQYKNAGSQLRVNYAAAYQWSSSSKAWVLAPDSSFNTNGSKPTFDTIKPDGSLSESDAWMQPQPGGAADWSWGYYPAGVGGVGPPGMLFVLSVESVWNVAWYMLNQVTLDKGPVSEYPNDKCQYGGDNCWASGNSGEIDFLESAWTVDAGATDGYRRMFATQWNQVGRSFVGESGSTCNADGGWFSNSEATNNYFLGTKPNQDEPYIFAAVVDRVGTFIYRIPSSQSSIYWPGLSRKTASCALGPRPSVRPPNSGPPCDDRTPYCALFIPNCQADAWGGASAGNQGGANQACKVNGNQGWCQNWWRRFDNTGQWVWPENGRPSVIQFQAPAAPVRMPWNYEMEAWKVDWAGNPKLNGGCCVTNKGHCPTANGTSPFLDH